MEEAGLSRTFWQSDDPGQQRTEYVFAVWSLVWCTVVAGILATNAFESFTEASYMVLGLFLALPCFVLPAAFASSQELHLPWIQRYAFKANVWIAIMAYTANHVWTHYFYQVLGAKYTFPSWRFNDVPVPLYFMTHAYFILYHTMSNYVMRRYERSAMYSPIGWAAIVIILSYVLAFVETFTIQTFPYYSFEDREVMYSRGSAFYALYFLVSFPMYRRIKRSWALVQTVLDACANCFLITMALDFWRIIIGPIHKMGSHQNLIPFIALPQQSISKY